MRHLIGCDSSSSLSIRGRSVMVQSNRTPQGDGRSVYRLVRELTPSARTVVISGFRSEMQEATREVIREGADAVCYKPFNVAELLSTVQQLSHRGQP